MAKRMSKAESHLLVLAIVIGAPLYGFYLLVEAVGWPWLISLAIAATGGYIWYQSKNEKGREAKRIREEEARNAELKRRADALNLERIREEAERIRTATARREVLINKYHDEKIVEAIMNRSYWQGQTAKQLKDSLGDPIDIDEKVLKTKKKEVWKYFPNGANRYGLRITLENDQVIGWDEKS